jgi:hypothetical protein
MGSLGDVSGELLCEVQVPCDVASLCVGVDEEEEGISEAANINSLLFRWKEATIRSACEGKGRCNGYSDCMYVVAGTNSRLDVDASHFFDSTSIPRVRHNFSCKIATIFSLQSETSHNALDIVRQLYKQTDGLNCRSERAMSLRVYNG